MGPWQTLTWNVCWGVSCFYGTKNIITSKNIWDETKSEFFIYDVPVKNYAVPYTFWPVDVLN